MNKTFVLDGLDCPNCAAKIEKEVRELSFVTKSEVNLLNQTLCVSFCDISDEALLEKISSVVKRHEPDVAVYEKGEVSASEHGHGDGEKMILRLIIGAAVYAAGILLDMYANLPQPALLGLFIAAYIILGGDVIFKAVKNICRGQVFDENFLMSLSSAGAFIIGEHPEAVAVMLFYQVGEFFQDMAVNRSRKSIASLMDIRPDFANVLRNGAEVTVNPESVSVGETIVIKPGEKIPLDGVVAAGRSSLDTKALTGEPIPRDVEKGDTVLSGSINQSGVLTIEVTKSFGESTAAKILDLVENAAAKKAPTENFITSFARYYTPAVVIFAALLSVIPPLIFRGEWSEWIRRGLVFLVVSCPCALVVSIPLAFFGGIGAASKKGVLVKGGNYLEALSKVKTVVFDKTGTLTKGEFHVAGTECADGFNSDSLTEYAAIAECYSNHPIAKSVLAAYGKEVDKSAVTDYEEIPGQGIRVKAGNTEILAGNSKLMEAFKIDFTQSTQNKTKVYVAVNGTYAGCVLIGDMIKQDSKRAISALDELGVEKTVMLTGDDEKTAEEVAVQLAIDEYHAQLLPQHKVEKLEEIDSKKPTDSKLAFVGDGINDAPVLARADIGIAMGGVGSDAAIEAADVVIMTDEISKIADAIKTARATRRIVVQNIVIALGIKCVFLLLGAFGIAGMWEAVFGDVGVAIIAVLNSMRVLKS